MSTIRTGNGKQETGNCHLQAPILWEALKGLRAGDGVLLSGVVYTARDAAHARLCAALGAGEDLPVDLRGQTVFYAGPTPPPPGKPSGGIGPTTSICMDIYTPPLLNYGVNAMIGKGERSEAVRQAIREHGAVYFAAAGGVAAYMAACVVTCEEVAYHDLGTESIKRLVVRELPLKVAIDADGNDFYAVAMQRYLDSVATGSQ